MIPCLCGVKRCTEGANERSLLLDPRQYAYVALDILYVIRSEAKVMWQDEHGHMRKDGGAAPRGTPPLSGFLRAGVPQHIYSTEIGGPEYSNFDAGWNVETTQSVRVARGLGVISLAASPPSIFGGTLNAT